MQLDKYFFWKELFGRDEDIDSKELANDVINQSRAMIFIFDSVNMHVYTTVNEEAAVYNNLSFIADYFNYSGGKNPDNPKIKRKQIEKTDKYDIQITNDRNTGNSYYDVVGFLDNGFVVIIRKPISSVDSTIVTSLKFFLLVFSVVALLGFVMVYFISNAVAKPIKNLASVANRMAQLDLDVKVDHASNDEIGELADSMNEMSYQLRNTLTELQQANAKLQTDIDEKVQIDEMRKEFLSHVSHELKTPLTSMKVLADSLVGQQGVPEELYQEFMSDITAEIDRENKIITDLLSLVKMDKKAADVNITHMDINQLLEDILKRLRPIADRRNIDLILDCFRPVDADLDEVKFTLAVSNLVENGIKYNVDDGWVRVSLDADHKYFYITVADSGMGIPEDSIERIFERFYRVDKSHSKEIGGTGLGLAITKSSIAMHHGTIKVFSKEGEGTTFSVRIPLSYIPS